MSVMLYPCILCVARFVLCVCELFGETIRKVFGCGCYFVVECYGGCMEVLCWIYHVCSSKESVCGACDPNVHLSISSIGFLYAFACRYKSLRAGSQVFPLIM